MGKCRLVSMTLHGIRNRVMGKAEVKCPVIIKIDGHEFRMSKESALDLALQINLVIGQSMKGPIPDVPDIMPTHPGDIQLHPDCVPCTPTFWRTGIMPGRVVVTNEPLIGGDN